MGKRPYLNGENLSKEAYGAPKLTQLVQVQSWNEAN